MCLRRRSGRNKDGIPEGNIWPESPDEPKADPRHGAASPTMFLDMYDGRRPRRREQRVARSFLGTARRLDTAPTPYRVAPGYGYPTFASEKVQPTTSPTETNATNAPTVIHPYALATSITDEAETSSNSNPAPTRSEETSSPEPIPENEGTASSRLQAQVHAIALELSRMRHHEGSTPPADLSSADLPPMYEQHEEDDLVSRRD